MPHGVSAPERGLIVNVGIRELKRTWRIITSSKVLVYVTIKTATHYYYAFAHGTRLQASRLDRLFKESGSVDAEVSTEGNRPPGQLHFDAALDLPTFQLTAIKPRQDA